ncbi:MAG: RNA methyltransferase [Peptococcaceae bacterium]
MGNLFLGLVHYPVYNKNMEVIATSITNMDVHDIARTATTYGIEKYFLVHPLETQHEITQEILKYWQEGYGGVYNPDRKKALKLVAIKHSIADVLNEIKSQYTGQIKIIVTDARKYDHSIDYLTLKEKINHSPENINYLILFGTGWGLNKDVLESADYRLLPIYGKGDYNHLSVRSAVAIILDRLCGEKWW